jgi:DNA-binding CsgD family transcriptional regulator
VTHQRTLVSPILVGRDDLLELADRRLAEAAAGRGHLLLLAGEAGVGKTRLVSAIERRAETAGFAHVRAGTYPSDLRVAAAILLDLGRALSRHPDGDRFGPIARALADRLDDLDRPGGDPHRRRRLLVLDVAEILAGLAGAGPMLLVLEDLHWCDDLTLEILETAARRIRDVPLLLVGTYRSDELYPRIPTREWRSRLLAARFAEEARLGRLSRDDTALLTRQLMGGRLPVAREVIDAIHDRTDGVPLYIEELLALIEPAALDAADAIHGAEVPSTVEDAIIARLEPRSDGAMLAAKAAAVIGRACDLDLLTSVVDIPPEALSDALGELADHFVLLPSRLPGKLGFRHALICDAIYDRIPELERRRLHAKAADAAVGRDVGTDQFLALQYERAGRTADAFAAAWRGARTATAISSHRDARELFEIASRTIPPDLPGLERAHLAEELGASLAATDANAAASDAFELARTSYLEAGEPLAAARVVAPYVAVRHLLGDSLDRRTQLLRNALGEIPTAPALHGPSADVAADRVRGRLLAALAAAFMLDRRLDEGIDHAIESRRLAAIAGDPSTELDATITLGACDVFAGRMGEGWSLLEGAVATALGGHLEAAAARAYRMLGSSSSVLLDYGRAERFLRDGIAHAERVELWNDGHYMASHLAHVLWATGRWDEAAATARHALADGRGGITTRITALHVLGFVSLGRGDLDAARRDLTEAADLGLSMGELQRFSPALWGLAEVALAAGEPGAAIELTERAAAASERVRDAAYLTPHAVTGARARVAAGDVGAARAWLERLAPQITARSIPGTEVAIDHARGLVELAEGSTGRARVSLEAAVAGWDRLGRVWEGTWARLDHARSSLRTNRRLDAARQAAEAAERARAIGATPLAGAADELAGTARRGAPAEPWAPLTAREFEVARLVAAGNTNGQIATALDVSPKTVAAHLEHILAKLGMGRRAEVAAWTATIPVLHSRPHGGDRKE